MKTRSVIFLFAMFLTATTFGQAYNILAFKGDVQVASNGTSFSKISYGSKIPSTAKVKVASGGYLAVIQAKSGKTLELKSAGTYTVSAMDAKLTAKASSFAKKYGDFVQNTMAGGNNSTNIGKYVTGSVDRGAQKGILIYSNENPSVAMGRKVFITWSAIKSIVPQETFIVSLMDLEGKVFTSKEFNDTVAELDLTNVTYDKNNPVVLLSIVPKTNPTLNISDVEEVEDFIADQSHERPPYMLHIIDGDKAETINTQIATYKENLELETSALDNLLMASYLEEQLLVSEAAKHYKKAVELAPDVESYKNAFADYKKRVGLDPETIKKAMKEWEEESK